MKNARQTFELAVRSHREGDVGRAEELCKKTLKLEPKFADALNLLGLIAHQQGHSEVAKNYFGQAIRIKPDLATAHNYLGDVFKAQGKLNEAAACYRQAFALSPGYAPACWNLAFTLQQRQQWDDSIRAYQQAILLFPDSPEAHNNLGYVFQQQGRLDEAIHAHRQALQVKPDFAPAHFNLGMAFFEQGQLAPAIDSYRRGLEKCPDDVKAQVNLGFALHCQGRFTEAITCYKNAQHVKPDCADAYLNLGIVLTSRVEHDQALANLREALRLKPDSALIWNSYLHTLHYCPGVSPEVLHREHVEFDRLHCAPLRAQWRPHENVRDPDRPLRLGFVSPHFDEHPVGYFLIRALENLDRGQAQVVCYSDNRTKDAMTARFQAAATMWRDVVKQSDEELASQIRADRIDILFDLAGHTGGNRLLAFARKPVPIQITWADYVGTTGLQAMDYILADRYEIPPDAEQWYVEKILRMPDDYICYEPPAGAPPVGPLPALTHGAVTFGSFNLPNKISMPTVTIWSRILLLLPQSRLILKYHGLGDEGTARRFHQLFADQGVDPNRIILESQSPHAEMLNHYQRLDIALDPFPYNGGLTTCEALWMGVPVVTCPGETFASRHALTHLTNAGFTEMIAQDLDQYVELTVQLAKDLPRLAAIRANMRENMADSPLCDGRRFAGNLLALLRQAWRQWLAAQGPL